MSFAFFHAHISRRDIAHHSPFIFHACVCPRLPSPISLFHHTAPDSDQHGIPEATGSCGRLTCFPGSRRPITSCQTGLQGLYVLVHMWSCLSHCQNHAEKANFTVNDIILCNADIVLHDLHSEYVDLCIQCVCVGGGLFEHNKNRPDRVVKLGGKITASI